MFAGGNGRECLERWTELLAGLDHLSVCDHNEDSPFFSKESWLCLFHAVKWIVIPKMKL